MRMRAVLEAALLDFVVVAVPYDADLLLIVRLAHQLGVESRHGSLVDVGHDICRLAPAQAARAALAVRAAACGGVRRTCSAPCGANRAPVLA